MVECDGLFTGFRDEGYSDLNFKLSPSVAKNETELSVIKMASTYPVSETSNGGLSISTGLQ